MRCSVCGRDFRPQPNNDTDICSPTCYTRSQSIGSMRGEVSAKRRCIRSAEFKGPSSSSLSSIGPSMPPSRPSSLSVSSASRALTTRTMGSRCLLVERDIAKIITSFTRPGYCVPFMDCFMQHPGLIFGIGPSIAEYWSVNELFETLIELLQEHPEFLAIIQRSPEKLYAKFVKAVRHHQRTDGQDIICRSNTYIQFRKLDTLYIRMHGDRYASAPEKSLSMGLETGRDSGALVRQGFFDRFQRSDYAIECTPFSAVKSGINKDWRGLGEGLDVSPYHPKRHLPSIRQFMVRRACKFLIYDEIARQGHIHYSLDGLDFKAVARAEHLNLNDEETRRQRLKVPVCTSELREIFRNWSSLQHCVTFYRHLEVVEPPWYDPHVDDETISLWADYAIHLIKKAQSLGSGFSDMTIMPSFIITRKAHLRVIRLYHSVPRANKSMLF